MPSGNARSNSSPGAVSKTSDPPITLYVRGTISSSPAADVLGFLILSERVLEHVVLRVAGVTGVNHERQQNPVTVAHG
jgi:hypothetical protein